MNKNEFCLLYQIFIFIIFLTISIALFKINTITFYEGGMIENSHFTVSGAYSGMFLFFTLISWFFIGYSFSKISFYLKKINEVKK